MKRKISSLEFYNFLVYYGKYMHVDHLLSGNFLLYLKYLNSGEVLNKYFNSSIVISSFKFQTMGIP